MESTTLIVGAGTSGLACARALASAGRRAVVLERSRGLGGRCATRRIGGQPVDHGAPFVHGSDPEFLAAARSVDPGEILDGWPRRVEGGGHPCLPRAFEARETRLAYRGGMTALAKALARGLDVRRNTAVGRIDAGPGGPVVTTESGERLTTESVVLALPAVTARRLLACVAGPTREMAAVDALLGMVGSQACLTLIAGYDAGGREPGWDVLYPDASAVVHLVVNDSAKREAPAATVLVAQSRPCWSRVHQDGDPESWGREIVAELARTVGDWAGRPRWVQAHRWRYARADQGSEMTRPIAVDLKDGGRIVVTGETFAPGAGMEAAWRAGVAAAERVLREESRWPSR